MAARRGWGRARSLLWMASGGSVALALDLPLRMWREQLAPVEAVAFALCVVAWSVVAVMTRRGLAFDAAARLFVLPALAMMAIIASLSGGVDSPAMAWIAMMPLAAAIVGSRRVALETLSLSLFIETAYFFGWLPMSHALGGDRPVDWFGNFVTISLVTWAAATFYEHQVETERAALVDGQVSFQTLADELYTGVLVLNTAGRVLYLNHRATTVFPTLAPGQALHEHLHVTAEALERMQHATQVRVDRGDEQLVVEVRSRTITFLGESCLLVTAMDRTPDVLAEQHRAELQRRLQLAEKLEGLGTLAGGVAHDFNNLLTPLKIAAASLLADPDDGHEVRESAQDIHDVVRRAEALIQGIRVYAGSTSAVLEDVELLPLVKRLVVLLTAGKAREVGVTLEAGALGLARTDTATLQRIVENLVVNALDATGPRGGTVHVEIGEVLVEPVGLQGWDCCSAGLPAPGTYAFIEVADTGCGIAEEHRRRLFDPFYTTKATGQGLGLSQVLGGVRQLGGALFLQTVPGEGTRFRVLLGVGSRRPTSATRSAEEPPRAQGRVLLVDDEPMVLKQVARVLERGGWTVESTTDPVRALALFTADSDTFDAAVVDFVMPELNGAELARRMTEHNPGVPILLASGYIESSTALDFGQMGVSKVLRKPFEPSELLWAVWEAVEAA